jgi:hypothetical protein
MTFCRSKENSARVLVHGRLYSQIGAMDICFHIFQSSDSSIASG